MRMCFYGFSPCQYMLTLRFLQMYVKLPNGVINEIINDINIMNNKLMACIQVNLPGWYQWHGLSHWHIDFMWKWPNLMPLQTFHRKKQVEATWEEQDMWHETDPYTLSGHYIITCSNHWRSDNQQTHYQQKGATISALQKWWYTFQLPSVFMSIYYGICLWKSVNMT